MRLLLRHRYWAFRLPDEGAVNGLLRMAQSQLLSRVASFGVVLLVTVVGRDFDAGQFGALFTLIAVSQIAGGQLC
jgi:hypothetical protein